MFFREHLHVIACMANQWISEPAIQVISITSTIGYAILTKKFMNTSNLLVNSYRYSFTNSVFNESESAGAW